MLLGFFTIVIMLAIAYAYLREGLFTSLMMCCNVFFAGLVAFNFWEPIASLLDSVFADTFLHGYEDILCLMALFCLTLGLLRAATNAMVNVQIAFPQAVQRGGAALFGLATGYLTAGFFLCALQTLPWHQNFMNFTPSYDPSSQSGLRQILPPDRVWLALMFRAGAFAFATMDEDPRVDESGSLYARHYTFDKHGTFELRYARYRRYDDKGDTLIYRGEFDDELRGNP
jgi:hypothetical protein